MSPKGLDFNQVLMEIGKVKRKFKTLSSVFDFVTEEVMPKIFRDKVDDIYKMQKKQLDYFMRHLA